MWSRDSNLVFLAFLWEKLSLLQIYKNVTKRRFFWGVVLVQVQYFGTGTRHDCELLQQYGRRVKIRKFWGLITAFEESGKTGRGQGFLPPSEFITIRVGTTLPGHRAAKLLPTWGTYRIPLPMEIMLWKIKVTCTKQIKQVYKAVLKESFTR